MRISDWSSDVCSSDLACRIALAGFVIPFMAVYAPALMLQPGDPRADVIGFWPAVAYVVGKAILAIGLWGIARSEEHTSELQSLMRISYDVFFLKKKTHIRTT